MEMTTIGMNPQIERLVVIDKSRINVMTIILCIPTRLSPWTNLVE